MTALLEPKTNPCPTRSLRMPGLENFMTAAPATLEEAVQATIGALDEAALKPLTPDDFGPFAQTRSLLARMVHCYARQIYGSADVADLARRDRDFYGLDGEEIPDARTIGRFRGANRQVIHHCLTAALQFLAAQKISLGVLTRVNDAQLAEEASRRIIMAAFVDTMEMDTAHLAGPPVELAYLFAKRHSRVH